MCNENLDSNNEVKQGEHFRDYDESMIYDGILINSTTLSEIQHHLMIELDQFLE